MKKLFMKDLNQLISEYTNHLQQGDIQVAYKGILDFIGKLRADFINRYPQYEIGSVYQGYMDMSYFSLNTKLLKDKGLKIAIVYLHEKGAFEVWLSARNREVLKRYKSVFDNNIIDNVTVFHDDKNEDAVIECTLTSTPDFVNQALLIDFVEQGTQNFVNAICNLL